MVVTAGSPIAKVNRISTGILPLDLILGGGIPENRVIEIFDLASSCKSILATKIVASKQCVSPKQRCVWIAVKPFDSLQAKQLGVEVDKVSVINAAHAEQVIDICEKFMGVDDCELVVLDSFASLITRKELKTSAEIGAPGVWGRRLFNAVMNGQWRAAEKGRALTFIVTNQMRFKIGAHGNEITPFRAAIPNNASSIQLRLYAKDMFDKTVHTGSPARKEIRAVIEEAKIPTRARECTFELAICLNLRFRLVRSKAIGR